MHFWIFFHCQIRLLFCFSILANHWRVKPQRDLRQHWDARRRSVTVVLAVNERCHSLYDELRSTMTSICPSWPDRWQRRKRSTWIDVKPRHYWNYNNQIPIADSFASGRESHPLSFRLLWRYGISSCDFDIYRPSIHMMIILNNLTTVDIATS